MAHIKGADRAADRARVSRRIAFAGFSIGADDYVAKPFEPAELALRINAILRRTIANRGETPELVTFGPFTFNTARGELTREGAGAFDRSRGGVAASAAARP